MGAAAAVLSAVWEGAVILCGGRRSCCVVGAVRTLPVCRSSWRFVLLSAVAVGVRLGIWLTLVGLCIADVWEGLKMWVAFQYDNGRVRFLFPGHAAASRPRSHADLAPVQPVSAAKLCTRARRVSICRILAASCCSLAQATVGRRS